MQSELASVEAFLSEEVPNHIQKLEENTEPLWGLMTPQHMVEHLIVIYKLSIGRIKLPVSAKEEDLPRLKAYLMKDSPMRRSVQAPNGNNSLQPLRSANLDEAVAKFLKETEHFVTFMKTQPDFVANHPFGGPMTSGEWAQFHRKHIKHHFIQFGLISDYEQ